MCRARPGAAPNAEVNMQRDRRQGAAKKSVAARPWRRRGASARQQERPQRKSHGKGYLASRDTLVGCHRPKFSNKGIPLAVGPVHDPALHAHQDLAAPHPQLVSRCGVLRAEGKLPGKVDVGQDEVRDEAARCLLASVQALPERQTGPTLTPDAVGLIRPLFAREALRLDEGEGDGLWRG